MRRIDTAEIAEKVKELALKACMRVTPECESSLKRAKDEESGENARFALKMMTENLSAAREYCMPVCQDTGLAAIFLEIGQEVFLEGMPLKEAVDKGVREAYEDGFFRKSVCDPLTRRNTGDNTPSVLHIDIVPGGKIKISFLPKGFGSENMSRIFMLTPSEGTKGIIDAVVSTVKQAGSLPCPPVFVGVGIGGTFDYAALLSKKALLRGLGTESGRADLREIERECLKRINGLGIGAQGFKGDITALGVNAECYPTHIAGLPVAVNIQCHIARAEIGEI